MADTWTQKPTLSEEETTSRGNEQSSSGSGHEDITGQYPKDKYINSSNVNKAAVGSSRNDLYIGGASEGADLGLEEQTASEYPLNQVQESGSGHIIEIDDTAGNQRILIKHNTGSGIEMRQDGTILVTTRQNKVEVVGSDNTVIVEGNGKLVYKGNLDLEVTGDYSVDVKGNYVVNVAGNRSEMIAGSDRKTIQSGGGIIVNGGYSTTVNGQVTNTFLGGYSHNVKGTFSNNVDGNANFFSSGSTTITSESDLIGAADNMTLSAQSMTVQGDTGTIGGENIIMYNYNMYTGHSIEAGDTITTHSVKSNMIDTTYGTATTWEGNLEGVAKFSAGPGSYTGPTTVSARTTDTTVTALPTAALLTEMLGKTAAGIRRVKIDVGDFIKNIIDKSNAYDGLSTTPINTKKARSKLRDPANRGNAKAIATLTSTGAIGSCYEDPAPKGIGRTVKGDPTPVGGEDGSEPIVFERGKVNIIPAWEYNAYNLGTITSKSKVGKGISIAKFLGTEDPVVIDHIRDNSAKVEIAKYYNIHATIMNTVNQGEIGDDFEDVNLVVTEGLYRPGPNETITPDSINDLKSKGRAVVYKLIDAKGNDSNIKLFDLAVKWKDTIPYDQLILSYDTIDCKLHARIIIILPELDKEWKGQFRFKVRTDFNDKVFAEGELVEALPFGPSGNSNFDATTLDSGGDYGLNVTPGMTPILDTTGVSNAHPKVKPEAFANMAALLDNEYALLQTYFGAPVSINDGIAKKTTKRKSNPPTSQHFFGKAIDVDISNMSDAERVKLVKAGLKAGFRGFGLGKNIIHFDNRNGVGRWFYGANMRYGITTKDWLVIIDKNVRG